MTNNTIEHIEDEQQEQALAESVKLRKIIVPILLGVSVVLFLVWRTFDVEAFKNLTWNGKTFFYFGLALGCYIIRHIFYSLRIKEVSGHDFGFWKSVELITIWEFASTVSPTSFGGSAVAIFLLAQEKITAAKSVAMVLYTVLVDTLYYVITIPLLFFIFGPIVLRPLADSGIQGYVISMWVIYGFTILYGSFMALGIYKPEYVGKFITWLGNRSWMSRFKTGLAKTAEDIEVTSKVLRTKRLGFHLRIILYTFIAWTMRFLAVVLVIIGVVQNLNISFNDISILFGRTEMMQVITQFSPTPGGAGVAEGMFGGFYADYIPKGVSTVIALIWRFITYYPYLFIGMLVIPNWLRGVMKRRASDKDNANS